MVRVEQRFRTGGIINIPFVRRSVSIAPEEGQIAFLDGGDENVTGPRRMGGKYQDGAWGRLTGAPLGFEPTFWTVIDEQALGSNNAG